MKPAMCYGSYTHLWKVQFTSVFSSSSGMTRYSNPVEDGDVFVSSHSCDLVEVGKIIAASAGPQCETKVITAQYLGIVYQPVPK